MPWQTAHGDEDARFVVGVLVVQQQATVDVHGGADVVRPTSGRWSSVCPRSPAQISRRGDGEFTPGSDDVRWGTSGGRVRSEVHGEGTEQTLHSDVGPATQFGDVNETIILTTCPELVEIRAPLQIDHHGHHVSLHR